MTLAWVSPPGEAAACLRVLIVRSASIQPETVMVLFLSAVLTWDRYSFTPASFASAGSAGSLRYFGIRLPLAAFPAATYAVESAQLLGFTTISGMKPMRAMACTTGPQSVVIPAMYTTWTFAALRAVAAAFGLVDGAIAAIVSFVPFATDWNAFDSPLPDAVWFSAIPTLAPFGYFLRMTPTSYWASAVPDGRY